MNRTQTLLHQMAFREFVEGQPWHMPHAVTLTMKQGRQIDGGRGMDFQPLSIGEASSNMRHFLNRLDQHVYGNAVSRYGKRVPVIPVIEGGNGVRLHYHLILDCPRAELKEGYMALIEQLWSSTEWGHKKVDVQADSDAGWTKYVSKLRDKPNYADSIDWANCHLLDRRD